MVALQSRIVSALSGRARFETRCASLSVQVRSGHSQWDDPHASRSVAPRPQPQLPALQESDSPIDVSAPSASASFGIASYSSIEDPGQKPKPGATELSSSRLPVEFSSRATQPEAQRSFTRMWTSSGGGSRVSCAAINSDHLLRELLRSLKVRHDARDRRLQKRVIAGQQCADSLLMLRVAGRRSERCHRGVIGGR